MIRRLYCEHHDTIAREYDYLGTGCIYEGEYGLANPLNCKFSTVYIEYNDMAGPRLKDRFTKYD